MSTMFAAALLGAALAGCVTEQLPPMDPRITVAGNLGERVYVTELRCVEGSGGFRTFQALTVNTTGLELPVQWRAVWYDGDGMEIDTIVSSWNDAMLQPNETKGLMCTAPSPDAEDVRIYIREMPR
ncbi:MAG: YcfL family protein [Kiritimatiellae bacterium]|nr:YcfL family protein [Kiritimatiellia bacterium]